MAGLKEQSKTIRVGASPQRVMEVLLDFESYPKWMSNVLETRVLKRDSRKRGKQVLFRVNAVIREVEYVLEYAYGKGTIDIGYVEGDLRDVRASYRLEDDGEGGTLLTYTYGADVGLPLAGFMAKRLNRTVMDAALKDVKSRAESAD
jgi:carbon monoxide dehydrogenase subunit G